MREDARMTLRERVGRRLRSTADWIDREHAFFCMTAVSGFTFEEGVGLVWREDGKGCRVWYRGQDYDRAYADADSAPPQIDWESMTIKQPSS